MSAIHIPNVREPAMFDANLRAWVEKKRRDAEVVFAEIVHKLHGRLNTDLDGLTRVEFYGEEGLRVVHVKFFRHEGEVWEQRWLFDLDDHDVAFFPYPAQ